jgi:hypothetical protein
MDILQALEGSAYPICLRYVGIRSLIQFGSLLNKKIYFGDADGVGQVL